ncbi:MAG: RidA family protein [Bacteroidetes Order II. Incertae sedis bacterium]|jgi:2-iminobutanoate/2-iminopropanoate deaminase|nr:RidA family protein [Bacteroidetes Order II. bacterium]MDG1754503.1 RidA family protein [Rhodothermales bacterium]MBT4052269.1 RidA family protein [Bacteroidetes Order II. bacterium]MBT4602805.1 RidA family protein [Bacteroidetes Order II. bacterium]MBT5248730.1 RidA family protein [Bacteroidetes Order II. bacterium]
MRRKELIVERNIIKTQLAPAAIGPYSQAVMVGDTLYCSGQIPIEPKTGHMVTEGIEAETEQVLENLDGLLTAAGMCMDHVVSCRVYMVDINDYAQINEIYARYFGVNAPAREAVQVCALPRGSRVEISCVAVR